MGHKKRKNTILLFLSLFFFLFSYSKRMCGARCLWHARRQEEEENEETNWIRRKVATKQWNCSVSSAQHRSWRTTQAGRQSGIEEGGSIRRLRRTPASVSQRRFQGRAEQRRYRRLSPTRLLLFRKGSVPSVPPQGPVRSIHHLINIWFTLLSFFPFSFALFIFKILGHILHFDFNSIEKFKMTGSWSKILKEEEEVDVHNSLWDSQII